MSAFAEFQTFALNQDECRQKWLTMEEECSRLQDLLNQANQLNSQLESKVRYIDAVLKHEIKCRCELQLENAKMVSFFYWAAIIR